MIPSLQAIDWRSFLARPPFPSPPPKVLEMLSRQPILITGAGGSIGSALALRLAALAPPKLILLESSESNLYALNQALSASFARITTILGSTTDAALIDHIFATHAPRLVFHVAAFKHVPLMEEQPFAAIANNIFATETLVRSAATHHARVILLSTDKAVEPASVMGATKRVAEHIVLSSGGTILRLGNVLASRDSVAEIFANQIARGGPITVTDPAARRYFLTLDEAVDLLLITAAHADPSALLAPILPATHFIGDLANFMAGELAPGDNIAIEFTHPRPGDKETERLWSSSDLARPANEASSTNGELASAALVSIQSHKLSGSQLAIDLASLRSAVNARDLSAALASLHSLVPDYTPSQSVLALSQQNATRVFL